MIGFLIEIKGANRRQSCQNPPQSQAEKSQGTIYTYLQHSTESKGNILQTLKRHSYKKNPLPPMTDP